MKFSDKKIGWLINIFAHILTILKRLMGEFILDLKDINFIRNQKNVYHVLIVISQLPLLMINTHYILEAIMLSNTIINFD